MNRKKINNKGFTLVELLAVIAILSVVVSITLYASMNVTKTAKDKSYEVTITNIEKNANNYVAENTGKIFYIESGTTVTEYQCVTVDDLIQMGYLGTNVLNSPVGSDRKVSESDFVYIERDINSKALLKSIYSNSNGMNETCAEAINAKGDITFALNPDINKWSQSKEITITYKLRNYQDKDAKSYKYVYKINGNEFEVANESSATTIATIEINSETTINAEILDNNGENLANKTINISKIDTTGPVVAIGNDSLKGNYNGTVKIPINITDNQSGVNYKSINKENFQVTIDGVSITSFSLNKISDDNYELVINDNTHKGQLSIKVLKDKVFDNVGNGNIESELSKKITMNKVYKLVFNANGGTIPQTTDWEGSGSSATKNVTHGEKCGILPLPTRTGYTFSGWYTEVSGGTKITKDTIVMLEKDQTLYASWTANTYTVTFDATGGSVYTSSTIVTYNSQYGPLPTPTKNNYTFDGWYTTSTGGTLISSNTTMTKTDNFTLYAHWTANTCTLNFDVNISYPGTINVSTKTVSVGSEYETLPELQPFLYNSNIAAMFTGWWTEATGGTKVATTTKCTTATTINLYAHWYAMTIYPYTPPATTSCTASAAAAETCMKANSIAWYQAQANGNQTEMDRLHEENLALSQIASKGSTYAENGYYYKADGSIMYDITDQVKTGP